MYNNEMINRFVVRFCSDTQLREIRENLCMTLVPALCNQLSIQLTQILLTEIQKSLFPIISAKLDAMKAQVHSEIAQKLTITDRVLKENISNMCRSKVPFLLQFFSMNIFLEDLELLIFVCFIGNFGRFWKFSHECCT